MRRKAIIREFFPLMTITLSLISACFDSHIKQDEEAPFETMEDAAEPIMKDSGASPEKIGSAYRDATIENDSTSESCTTGNVVKDAIFKTTNRSGDTLGKCPILRVLILPFQ